jgi:hypothetical protein
VADRSLRRGHPEGVLSTGMRAARSATLRGSPATAPNLPFTKSSPNSVGAQGKQDLERLFGQLKGRSGTLPLLPSSSQSPSPRSSDEVHSQERHGEGKWSASPARSPTHTRRDWCPRHGKRLLPPRKFPQDTRSPSMFHSLSGRTIFSSRAIT